jgi:hypothetical protein
MIAVWLCLLLVQIPDSVKNEPVVEKRYQLALLEAGKILEAAKDNDSKKYLEAAADLCEFALTTIESMGKPPHKNASNYKKIELKTRDFLRRAEAIRKEASIDDRPSLEAAFSRINAVHEKVLEGVMSKKP